MENYPKTEIGEKLLLLFTNFIPSEDSPEVEAGSWYAAKEFQELLETIRKNPELIPTREELVGGFDFLRENKFPGCCLVTK